MSHIGCSSVFYMANILCLCLLVVSNMMGCIMSNLMMHLLSIPRSCLYKQSILHLINSSPSCMSKLMSMCIVVRQLGILYMCLLIAISNIHLGKSHKPAALYYFHTLYMWASHTTCNYMHKGYN